MIAIEKGYSRLIIPCRTTMDSGLAEYYAITWLNAGLLYTLSTFNYGLIHAQNTV